jgi:hypothetical protein
MAESISDRLRSRSHDEQLKARTAEKGESLKTPTDPRTRLLTLQRTAGNRAVSRALSSLRGSSGPESESGDTVARTAAMSLPGAGNSAAALSWLRGSEGRPLDAPTRLYMESRFQEDFSRVRIHTGARATASAEAVRAKAYTVGGDVVFGQGSYAPDTSEGKRLLAHELAHVIQQNRGGTAPALNPNSSIEKAADVAASGVVNGGGTVSVQGGSGVGISRQEDDTLPWWKRRLNPLYQKALEVLPEPAVKRLQQANEAAKVVVRKYGITDDQINSEVQKMEPLLEPARQILDIPGKSTPSVTKGQQPSGRKTGNQGDASSPGTATSLDQDDPDKYRQQFEAELQKSQRTPPVLLSFLGPSYVQAYYRNPSAGIKNPVLRQQADLATQAVAGHGALGTTALAGATGIVAASTLLLLGAVTVPVVVAIGAEAAAGSAALAPVVSVVFANPIAATEIAQFGFGVVISIAAAGGIKNYLDQITTPEGALQVAFDLFILHATVRSNSGGPPRQVTIKGKVEEASPQGFRVRITEPAEGIEPPPNSRTPEVPGAEIPGISPSNVGTGGKVYWLGQRKTATAANDNAIPIGETQPAEWVQSGTGGWIPKPSQPDFLPFSPGNVVRGSRGGDRPEGGDIPLPRRGSSTRYSDPGSAPPKRGASSAASGSQSIPGKASSRQTITAPGSKLSTDTRYGEPEPSLNDSYWTPPPITGNPKADRFEQSQRRGGTRSLRVQTGRTTSIGTPEDVEFDDYRRADSMLVDAKARTRGPRSIYDIREKEKPGKPGFRRQIVRSKVMKQEAARQVSGAKGVVWVVQDPEIADALRDFFRREGFKTFHVEEPR